MKNGCVNRIGEPNIEGSVEIGDHGTEIHGGPHYTNMYSMFSPGVHSSTGTHIDNMNHWIDPRLGFSPDWLVPEKFN